jgi:ankyrin repeat protein
MPDLPARPDIGLLHSHATELLRAARDGDAAAVTRIEIVSKDLTLDSARLTVAREHGFDAWVEMATEIKRRDILNRRDVRALAALLADRPELAMSSMLHWCDHPRGAAPLGYIAMLRFDARRLGLSGPLPGTGVIATALIEAGAPVDGDPADRETPLITAASYGDAEVAAVLIAAGADVDAVAAPDSGGVPGGTALAHAAIFGMTAVVDLLVAAGARVNGLIEAAAVGEVTGLLTPAVPGQERIRALVTAADHERLEVIDLLLEAGTPVDATDAEYGFQALRTAAQNGRAASVERLLARGADPSVRDPEYARTALEWSRHRRGGADDTSDHDRVQALLAPVTPP